MLYSFDVFDTLITRTVATPKGIFSLMQEQLLQDTTYKNIPLYIRENFFELRIHAEELARGDYQRGLHEDVTLEQIYEALATNGALSDQEIVCLAALERDTECKNVVGVDENIAKVKNLLAQGNQVVLISDMYLDCATIRKMLVIADPIFVEIPLYVSSEQQKGKYSGHLYYAVRAAEQATFDQWMHMGDNIHSDVNVPMALGIRAIQFDYAGLLPIEQDRIAAHENDVYTQVTIGTARNTRLLKHLKGKMALGCSMAGPILFAYVQWILAECRRRDIRRLYFIARDGYMPKQIADVLIDQWGLDIETHYLYGSRRAWRMPAYDGHPDSLRQLIAWSYPDRITNLEKLADVLQITIEQLMSFLPVAYQDRAKTWQFSDLGFCVLWLDRQAEFRKFLYAAMKSARQVVIGYLQQEMTVADAHFAFVDLGGGGFTQGCLANLLEVFCPWPVRTFFFKMDRVNLMKNCMSYTFLPSKLKDELVIEMICRSDHGQTEGYKRKAARWEPVLKPGEGERIKAYGYDAYMAGVRDFCVAYAGIVSRFHLSVRIDLLLQYMDFLMCRPDRELLNFLADMPNSVTGREQKVIGFAPKLTRQNIRDIFLLHVGEPIDVYYHGSDLKYSRLRCTREESRKINFYEQKGNLIKERFQRLLHRPLVPATNALHSPDPFEGLPLAALGPRIALYGAGKYGQRMYRILLERKVPVVAWLDQQYAVLVQQGLPVTGTLDNAYQQRYDSILIAIRDVQIACEIEHNLLSGGVEAWRIFWLGNFRDWYLR